MKKIILTLALFAALAISANAQIRFSTGQTLQKGAFSIGIEPVINTNGSNFALFFHGGYGVGHNADLGLKLGFGWSNPYIGLDYEKSFLSGKPSVSAHGGAHYWNDFGLDFGSTVTFPIKSLYLSTGLDADLDFGSNANNDLNMYLPLWLPLEMEYYLQKHLSLVFEANIKLTRSAFTTVGGGLSVYF